MCSLQLDIICTYKTMIEDGEDEVGFKHLLYQLQLLQILDLELCEYDIDRINSKITDLYGQLKEEPFVQELLITNPYRLQFNDDDELIFRTLFSYDYLDLFHRCLYCYFNKVPMDKAISLLKMEYRTN